MCWRVSGILCETARIFLSICLGKINIAWTQALIFFLTQRPNTLSGLSACIHRIIRSQRQGYHLWANDFDLMQDQEMYLISSSNAFYLSPFSNITLLLFFLFFVGMRCHLTNLFCDIYCLSFRICRMCCSETIF